MFFFKFARFCWDEWGFFSLNQISSKNKKSSIKGNDATHTGRERARWSGNLENLHYIKFTIHKKRDEEKTKLHVFTVYVSYLWQLFQWASCSINRINAKWRRRSSKLRSSLICTAAAWRSWTFHMWPSSKVALPTASSNINMGIWIWSVILYVLRWSGGGLERWQGG